MNTVRTAPSRPSWVRTAVAAFLISLTAFVAVAVVAAIIEDIFTRRFRRAAGGPRSR